MNWAQALLAALLGWSYLRSVYGANAIAGAARFSAASFITSSTILHALMIWLVLQA